MKVVHTQTTGTEEQIVDMPVVHRLETATVWTLNVCRSERSSDSSLSPKRLAQFCVRHVQRVWFGLHVADSDVVKVVPPPRKDLVCDNYTQCLVPFVSCSVEVGSLQKKRFVCERTRSVACSV